MSGGVKITPTVTLGDGTVVTPALLRQLIEGLTAEILAGAVTARELADGAISEDKLDSAVRNQLGLPDGAVTVAKIADGALTADATGRAKMADGYITAAKIVDATITAVKLDASLVWPVGIVVEGASETVPTGWLHCNGAAVSRTTYAALFAVIGTVHGVGDGSTTFNVPETRGYFKRGWDNGAGNDPDAATRTGGDHVGSTQNDDIKPHTHTLNGATTRAGTGLGQGFSATGAPAGYVLATGGEETRPINKAFMDIIKY